MTASAQDQEKIPARLFVACRLLDLDRHMTTCEALIVDADAPEALHDYRVAIRKVRAMLAQMDQIMPEPQLSRCRRGFAELMKRTCLLRDLQVSSTAPCFASPAVSSDTTNTTGLLQQAISQQQRKAYLSLRRYLLSARLRRFRAEWLSCLQQMQVTDRPADRADDPVSVVARKSIRHAYQITVRQAHKAGKRMSGASLHRLRKQCKDLRYVLEMYSDLFEGQAVTDLGHALKRVQGKLGKVQDLQVLYLILRAVAKAQEDKLDRQQHKFIKRLLKHIRLGKRELKAQAARLVRKYPQRSAGYIATLIG